jgi:hypothetical protein
MNDGTIGTWSYRAGDWFAVFGARTTLLLPESERDRVVGLWALVDQGADFAQVLDGLLASGLSALQGFALVSTDEGPTRILLRGDGVRAALTTETEALELDGAGSTTWAERAVEGVTALHVSVADDVDGPDFPIDAGLVRVSRIDLPPAAGGRRRATEVEFEGVTVLPAPADIEEEPDLPDTADQPVTEPLAAPPDYLQPWPEPEPEPSTAHIPSPPSPPPFGDIPPPPPAPPAPGPWGDAGLPEPPPSPPSQLWGDAELPEPPPSPPSPPEPGPWGDAGLPEPPPPESPPSSDSDHDGLTQAGMNPDEFALEQPGIPGQPMAPSVTRPVAKLIISNGETVDVDRVVLIGRAPEARRFTSTEQPMLVTVPSPMHEISSTHVEVRPGSGADHGSAVVTDMGSTNGTVLVQPGLPPEDLKPGIAVQLIPGAIINLGDGLTIQVARP